MVWFFFFFNFEILSIIVEIRHFSILFARCQKCRIEDRDGHGKSRNGHGTYFVKSVGTLLFGTLVMGREFKETKMFAGNQPTLFTPRQYAIIKASDDLSLQKCSQADF